MKHYWISLFFLLCFSSLLLAQQPDSLDELRFLTDTSTTLLVPAEALPVSSTKERKFLGKLLLDGYPHPGKAALFSIVPGMGQVYNKKFWKVPIVFTAVGSMIYLIDFNGRNYQRYKTAYRLRVDGDETTIDEFVDIYSQADRLKTIRDGYRKNRELSYIGLAATFVLSAADAFVDAHLTQFNVSDDLSLKVKPNVQSSQGLGTSFGVGIQLKFAN